MPTRKLEELNLLDDFLFGTMVTYPVIGEKFVRELLQTIFDREFGKLTMVPQKVYYGSNTDKHGARLDVYVEEETEEGTDIAYDVEPDMPYDDGAETIFLYTKGKKGDKPEKLCQLLHYMEDSREENAVNESLRNLHQMVTRVKQDGEVVLEYMKICEREAMLIKQGRKQGREEEQANTERERKRAYV